MTYQLAPLEVATGLVLGVDPRREVVAPRLDVAESPLRAFERAVLPALRRGPCLVSFSGGRDSSAVLAVATGIARREGLPLPIPVTNVFPGAATTDESFNCSACGATVGPQDRACPGCGLEFAD